MIIWRLTAMEKYSDAFSGKGASEHGGRWNSIGIPLVYAAQNVSLAILESLVHFDIDISPMLYLYEIEIEDKLILQTLPSRSVLEDDGKCRSYGDLWVQKNANVAAMVPSIIVDVEYNIIINPEHGDFAKLNIKPHGLFKIDERLTRKK